MNNEMFNLEEEEEEEEDRRKPMKEPPATARPRQRRRKTRGGKVDSPGILTCVKSEQSRSLLASIGPLHYGATN